MKGNSLDHLLLLHFDDYFNHYHAKCTESVSFPFADCLLWGTKKMPNEQPNQRLIAYLHNKIDVVTLSEGSSGFIASVQIANTHATRQLQSNQ